MLQQYSEKHVNPVCTVQLREKEKKIEEELSTCRDIIDEFRHECCARFAQLES